MSNNNLQKPTLELDSNKNSKIIEEHEFSFNQKNNKSEAQEICQDINESPSFRHSHIEFFEEKDDNTNNNASNECMIFSCFDFSYW